MDIISRITAKNRSTTATPSQQGGTADPLVNAIVPETSKLLGYIADVLKTDLDETAFKALKIASAKNFAVMQGIYSWGAIDQDIGSGTPPSVAVGSEVAFLAASTLFSTGVTLAVAGLGVAGLPLAATAVIANVGVSLALDSFGFKGSAAELISDALQNAGLLPFANRSVVDGASTLVGASSLEGEDDATIFSDYEFYRALKEISEHPELYPESEGILSEILHSIGDKILAEEIARVEAGPDDPSLRPPPEIVQYSEIVAVDGVKSFTGEADRSYLFVGDDTANEMIGGGAVNWLMPVSDRTQPSKVWGNPDGYNVLDFSSSSEGVDIYMDGNDRLDQWIADRAQEAGITGSLIDHSFLTRDNFWVRVREGYKYFEPLNADSDSILTWEWYKNIDYVIGSYSDDIFVGDVPGGMTFTGRAGNDTFVVHGGSNRIVFSDGDFAAPDSGEVTTKFIHGITTSGEAEDFNARMYIPEYLGMGGTGGFRIDPDVLDFSSLDGDLGQAGHQSMRFIGVEEFTGNAGELRYVTREEYGITVADYDYDAEWSTYTLRLQGDRTGSGQSDFFIEYTAYVNPSTGTPATIPIGEAGLIFPYLGDENLFFG